MGSEYSIPRLMPRVSVNNRHNKMTNTPHFVLVFTSRVRLVGFVTRTLSIPGIAACTRIADTRAVYWGIILSGKYDTIHSTRRSYLLT